MFPRHAHSRCHPFENLSDGLSLDEILEQWPTLNRSDVQAVLGAARHFVERTAA
ncbi:DUF433 domain-containing protein [Azospirillum sp. ST 5-10]|uniref:DUF433 domain-containing protein n=1 Tax=unclassified Azospirillum TaxID=2630922 RepID=UPI003F49DFAA